MLVISDLTRTTVAYPAAASEKKPLAGHGSGMTLEGNALYVYGLFLNKSDGKC